MLEFRIDLRIGLIASGRNVEIMDTQTFRSGRNHRAQMPAIGNIAKPDPRRFGQRAPREGRNAVIAFLAADLDMLIPGRMKRFARKKIVRAFRFLQAQHIRLIVAQGIAGPAASAGAPN